MGVADAGGPEIDRVLGRVPVGSGGLRFWPFLTAGGAAGLDPNISGRLAGVRLSHGAGEVLRAVLEGLVLELARYLALLTSGDVAVRRLVLCGGAARSRVTPQIIADVTGLPVATSGEPDTSAVGAAMIARSLAEGGRDLGRIAENTAPALATFEPGADAASYRQLLDGYLSSLPYADSAGAGR